MLDIEIFHNYNFLILNLNVFRLDKNCTKKRNNYVIKKYFFILVKFWGWERSFKNSYFTSRAKRISCTEPYSAISI